jgi:hypothetical protein
VFAIINCGKDRKLKFEKTSGKRRKKHGERRNVFIG